MAFYSTVLDFSSVIDQQRDIATLPQVFERAMLDVAVDVEQTYLPRLQAYPPARDDSKFRFATPKSRRKWFAMVAAGEVKTDGKHYIRTGGYAKLWLVELGQEGDTYNIRIGTRDQAQRGGTTIGGKTFKGGQFLPFLVAEFIGGNRQVPGHADTGWVKFHPILNEVGDFTNERFYRMVKDYV